LSVVKFSGHQVGGQLNMSARGWKEAETIHSQGAVNRMTPTIKAA
jgi:hypothetical protein